MILYINKVFLLVLSIVFINAAKSDISISGYQEFFAGSADQSIATIDSNAATTEHGIDKAGMSNGTYTRLTATYSTTLDSGLEVAGTYTAHARDCMADRTANCGVTNFNNVALSGSFGTIGIGEKFDVGASEFSRLTAGVATAEPDGGNIGHFYSGGSADVYNFGSANESNYADNSMKITYNTNVYNGFSFSVGFTPNIANEGAAGTDAQAATIQNSKYTTFTDITTAVAKYATEMDGIGLEFAYGLISGNAGQVASVNYNDLEETVYSVALSYAGFTADYRKNEAGDSGQIKNNNAGNDQGTSICAKYSMSNIGIGACQVETNFTDTSNFDNNSMTRTYSADYNLGGGVTVGAVYFDVEQTANNVTITDADGIMTMLAIGF